MAYSAQKKAQAKALAVAFGNAEEARRVLGDHWPGPTPTSQVIRLWVNDDAIEPDLDFFQDFSAEQKRRVLGSISRLLEPLEQGASDALADGKSLDVLNSVKAWGIVVDKLRPETKPGYLQSFTYVDQTERRDPMMLFGPKQPSGDAPPQ